MNPKYPSIQEMIQKLQEAGRTPIVPAPNRWFADPVKHPFQQKMIERVLAQTKQGREGFPSGSYINPQTGEPMDFDIMHDLGVAIDPNTGRPMMSGIKSDLTEIDPKYGSVTKSNLVRKGLFKHEGGDELLKNLAFLATIEKSGKGHHYGLSTHYASPAELVNTMTGKNPTLRPHSRGDIFGVGDEVGRISIQGKHHPVYEKLFVAPAGSDVQGKKLHKAKGGVAHLAIGGQGSRNWMKGSVEDVIYPLKTHYGVMNPEEIRSHQQAIETAKRIHANSADPVYHNAIAQMEGEARSSTHANAMNQWVERNLGNYIKKQMATHDDPIRKLAEQGITHLPNERFTENQAAGAHRVRHNAPRLGQSDEAKSWEDRSDLAMDTTNVGKVLNDEGMAHIYGEPWMQKADPETKLFKKGSLMNSQMLGFDHLVDILKQDLAEGRIRPDQLSKVSIEHAVRRAHEYDQERKKAMAETALKATEGMPVHKEYPEGYKWIELALNKELPEGHTMSPSGTYVDPQGNESIHHPNYGKLEDALKYEGDTMGHCVGGYCPDVAEGRSRIFSLRDAKNEPHVTIEVEPVKKHPIGYGMKGSEQFPKDFRYEKGSITPEQQQKIYQRAKELFNPESAKDIGQHRMDVFQQAADEVLGKPAEQIVQIKGKGNAKPKKDYIPYVQDFVKSGNWSDVGDLENAELIPIGGGKYASQEEAKKHYEPRVKNAIDFLQNHPAFKEQHAAKEKRNKNLMNFDFDEQRKLENIYGRPMYPKSAYSAPELLHVIKNPEENISSLHDYYPSLNSWLNEAEKGMAHHGYKPKQKANGGTVHMADGGDMDTMKLEMMRRHMAGGGSAKPVDTGKRVTIHAEGSGGVKGIVVPRHTLEGNPKAGAIGLHEMNEARAKVYGEEHREPLTLSKMASMHKKTLADHFAKPLEEQHETEEAALNRLREAKHIGKTANTLDESEKLDTVRHEEDAQGRTHVGYASKGVAGHALYTSGHGNDTKYNVVNTCPGQTEGCGGGKDAQGIVDTKKGTCFAPNAESQYAAAAVRRAAHAQAKHDPAMTNDWILAHTGSLRNAARLADKGNKRLLFRPNVVDETDVTSRHVIRHLNDQRKAEGKPPIIANSYGKTNELHDPENGYYVTHSNVGPKVKKGESIAENIGRDKARVRNTIMAADNKGDFRNEQGNKTPPKGSYMVTDVKRGSPMAKKMEAHITHAKYWTTGREEHELTPEEKAEGPEGHFGGNGKPTSPDKAHFGHTTVANKRFDYQKQHILHPRLVQVGENKDGTPHMIPTDSRFKDEEFLPKNRFKTKNGKEAGHILMTTPTESTSNIGHQTSFTHNVSDKHIDHAIANKGEYEIDKPQDQLKAAGKEYSPPQPIKFYAEGGGVGGDRHIGFSDDNFHAFPEQNVVAQRHLAMRDEQASSKPTAKKVKFGDDFEQFKTKHLMRKADGGQVDVQSIGVNEAPNMDVKMYFPPRPAQGSMLPVGGIQQAQQAPMQPPPPMPNQPQPQQQPSPAPIQAGQPPSNILQMTPQGQAMNAIKPPQMARGGQVDRDTMMFALMNRNKKVKYG